MPTATEIFAFLDKQRSCDIETTEIFSAPFGAVRQNMRSIILRLRELGEESALEASERLRLSLSEWLTVPIRFEPALVRSLDILGEPGSIATRWGADIHDAYDAVCSGLHILAGDDNPIREAIRTSIRELSDQHQSIRILCHKKARTHFLELLEPEMQGHESASTFLHSLKDYRESPIFDVLIKMGPLRSKGWGKAPDAILTAPRFTTLRQFIWTGSYDEEGFGYDPVSPAIVRQSGAAQGENKGGMAWTRHVASSGTDTFGSEPAAVLPDEFSIFATFDRGTDLRQACLLQIDGEHGILYSPHSQVLSYAPGAKGTSVANRVPGETLAEGMFVILPVIGDPDMGALRAGEGQFSAVWKHHLRDALRRDPAGLVSRLEAGGIDLLNLRSRSEEWCRPASTVIHAPQRRRHFEILIKVLAINAEAPSFSGRQRRAWWEYAWDEIRRSRGAAIQTGMQEQEIIEEQLLHLLSELLPQILSRGPDESMFEIEMPEGRALQGLVRFFRVASIEDGFRVPESMLRVITPLDLIEQWRD